MGDDAPNPVVFVVDPENAHGCPGTPGRAAALGVGAEAVDTAVQGYEHAVEIHHAHGIKLVFFADGELYEVACVEDGQEALVCHALRGNKGDSRRIILVDSPAQIAKINCPGISGFCTVEENGQTHYFKKAGGT